MTVAAFVSTPGICHALSRDWGAHRQKCPCYLLLLFFVFFLEDGGGSNGIVAIEAQ
jgi:hypothetical protein